MKEIYEIRRGGFRWQLLTPLAGTEVERLLGSDGFRFELVDSTVVKHAPHRSVRRVVVGSWDLHVKQCQASAREWVRCLFRRRRAAREFALSREVARRGVPTIEALGFGQRTNPLGASDCVLLTRTLPDTRTLIDFVETGLPRLPRPLRALVQHKLAEAVGKLLACKHRAGVRHDDLHPGNLLVRFVGGEPELFLIDLDAVRLCPPLDWRQSRDNLVMLDRWFALRFHRSDRRRAWRAYCAAREDLAVNERRGASELAIATQTTMIGQMWQFDRRCLGGNRHFQRVRASGSTGLAVTDLDRAALVELLAAPDAPFERPGAKLLKQSPSSAVVEFDLPVRGERQTVIYKRLAVRTWARSVASLVYAPAAMRAYVLGHGFRLRALPSPRPLAVWHRRRFGLARDGYLLVEKVPDAVLLPEIVVQYAGRPAAERLACLGGVIDDLARLIRRMHESLISHRDLKAANILVSPVGYTMASRGLVDVQPCLETRRDRVWFIDLAGVRRLGKLSRERRVQDLARLHVSFIDNSLLSRTDRVRFLRAYLVWGLAGREGWKDWWKDIHRAACEKVARNRARGRIVG